MSFIPQLKEFLLKNGVIYTVRKYRMIEAIVEVAGVGRCRRVPVRIVQELKDLVPYVAESGFSTVEAWWSKIRFFIPDCTDVMYLYKVEVVGIK